MAPEPRSEDDIALLYPQAKQKESIVADEAILREVALMKESKALLAQLEQAIEANALAIKRFMGHADTLLDQDGKTKLATWGNRKGRSAFDIDGFVGHLCPGATPAERAIFIEDAKRTYFNRGEPGRTFSLK